MDQEGRIKKRVSGFIETYGLGNGPIIHAPESAIHKIARKEGINAILLADFYHMYLYLGEVMGSKRVYDTKGRNRKFDNSYYGRIIFAGKSPASFFGWNVKELLDEVPDNYNLVSRGIPEWVESIKQEIPGSCGLYCLAIAEELSKEMFK